MSLLPTTIMWTSKSRPKRLKTQMSITKFLTVWKINIMTAFVTRAALIQTTMRPTKPKPHFRSVRSVVQTNRIELVNWAAILTKRRKKRCLTSIQVVANIHHPERIKMLTIRSVSLYKTWQVAFTTLPAIKGIKRWLVVERYCSKSPQMKNQWCWWTSLKRWVRKKRRCTWINSASYSLTFQTMKPKLIKWILVSRLSSSIIKCMLCVRTTLIRCVYSVIMRRWAYSREKETVWVSYHLKILSFKIVQSRTKNKKELAQGLLQAPICSCAHQHLNSHRSWWMTIRWGLKMLWLLIRSSYTNSSWSRNSCKTQKENSLRKNLWQRFQDKSSSMIECKAVWHRVTYKLQWITILHGSMTIILSSLR